MDEINSQETSHKGQKRRNYSLKFKATAVEYAENNSIRSAAVKYDVDRKRIREWSQKADVIAENNAKSGGSKRKRLDGGGRKLTDTDLEDELVELIYKRRENMLRVSRKLIMSKAKYIYDENQFGSSDISLLGTPILGAQITVMTQEKKNLAQRTSFNCDRNSLFSAHRRKTTHKIFIFKPKKLP